MNSITGDDEVPGARVRWALFAWAVCALVGCAVGASRDDSADQAPSQPAASPAGAPVLYVVDAANTLQSFDAEGNSLRKFQFNPQVGTLNGGLTLFNGNVYATSVKGEGAEATSRVFAYDGIALKQVPLHIGAFTVPGDAGTAVGAGAYRAIVYSPGTDRFYVASERLGLLVFDRLGTYIPPTGAKPAPVSALAYDSAQHVLWGIIERRTVKFGADGSDPLPGLPALGAQYRHGRGAVALAYCPVVGDGALGSIAVAFGDPRLGPHSLDAARAYDAGGKPIGTSYSGKILNARAMACSSRGEVFIAADNGLLQYTVQGALGGSHSYAQQLTAPIYGVLTAN